MPEASPKSLLEEFPVISIRKVNWRDVDAAQHVNNTKYLEWAESGRLDYFAQFHASTGSSHPQGTGPVLAAVHCKYRFPMTFPDTVWIGTRMPESLAYRYYLEARLISEKHMRIVAEIRAKLVLFDFDKGEKLALPKDFLENRMAFESRARQALHSPESL